MVTDRLRELLRRADAAAGPPPPLPPDLAARVWWRAARQRQRWILAGSAAAAAALALALSLPPHSHAPSGALHRAGPAPPLPAPRSSTAELEGEIARLQAEATLRMAVAHRLIALRDHEERLAALVAVADRPDPARRAQVEADRAAIVLIQQGDHLRGTLRLPTAAAESYRCALRAFVGTPWADIARARLNAVENSEGEHL